MLVRFDCLSSLFVCDRCTFNDGAHFLSALDCRLLVRRSISPAFCLYHIVIQGYSIRGPIEFCFLLNRAVAKYRCALCRLDILILYEYFCHARVFRLKVSLKDYPVSFDEIRIYVSRNEQRGRKR